MQSYYQRLIHQILGFCDDPDLSKQILRPRVRLLPSIKTSLIEKMLSKFNRDGQTVEEFSRFIVHPDQRGAFLSNRLAEFDVAYARQRSTPIAIASCNPEHVKFYAKFGFSILPGTGLAEAGIVGQPCNMIVCNTRRMQLFPEPSRSNIVTIDAAFGAGKQVCIVDASAKTTDGRCQLLFT